MSKKIHRVGDEYEESEADAVRRRFGLPPLAGAMRAFEEQTKAVRIVGEWESPHSTPVDDIRAIWKDALANHGLNFHNDAVTLDGRVYEKRWYGKQLVIECEGVIVARLNPK